MCFFWESCRKLVNDKAPKWLLRIAVFNFKGASREVFNESWTHEKGNCSAGYLRAGFYVRPH